MKYTTGTGKLTNWLITESQFNPQTQGKCEAIFTQGNGYMGIRHATEEDYVGQLRNIVISGTFNKFDEDEVTELPNAADITALSIYIDGERFSLDKGVVKDYERTLNLQNGEVVRQFHWTSPKGKVIHFRFKRFVSKANRHLVMNTWEITPQNDSMTIEIESAIDAQQTNTGSQHFSEGEKRVYDKKYVQLVQRTTESDIDFIFTTTHDVYNGEQEIIEPEMIIHRRKIAVKYEMKVEKGVKVTGEKKTLVYTSRDNDITYSATPGDIQVYALNELKKMDTENYDALLEESSQEWNTFWNTHDILITGDSDYDQLALRFAQYHLAVFTPIHDSRMGIGAKGLSGQGYKGHSFWDTEIFMFPYWLFTEPEIARSLMEYRYNTIGGAYKKAKDNGFEGAMYPWESAWKDDGETTPLWGAVDIVTGEATPILSGLIEIHITADIALALWQYYIATGDEVFMEKYGYQMIFETARFWNSRLEWNEAKKQYEITDVVGSDEYKEHVDNDAVTNYLAYHNMEIAITCLEHIKKDAPHLLPKMEETYGVEELIKELKEKMPKVYRPQPRKEDGLIPQDDTYLTLEDIDLTKYKNQENVGSMFKDYNLEQVNKMQVTKQSDVVMVLYLLEHLFDNETKSKNFDYYEARTLHDSSLSLSTHAIVGNDLGKYEMAYELFKKATEIDLGPNMKTSDDGIHAAAMGGIWQATVNGFGGVRIIGNDLRIEPRLPESWERLQYNIFWKNQPLHIDVNKKQFTITNNGVEPVEILCNNDKHIIQRNEIHTFTITR